MFASSERKLIKKDYREHISYNNQNVWTYLSNKCNLTQVYLNYDKNKDEYIFSFPMKNSEINYKSHFSNYGEAINYINYILNDYL